MMKENKINDLPEITKESDSIVLFSVMEYAKNNINRIRKEIDEYLCRRDDKRLRLIIYYIENNKKNLDTDLTVFDYSTQARARKMGKECEHYHNLYWNTLKIIKEMRGIKND